MFRPRYPSELFPFLASLCNCHEVALDCATGSGQAAVALTEYFERVLATDASPQQIAAAQKHRNIQYWVRPAEESGLNDASVDLVTVAQALHWFDIDAFLAEAGRVLKPGGVLAVWTYDDCKVSPEIDGILDRILSDIEEYWPPEREIVFNRYRDIALPWAEAKVPGMDMTELWTVELQLGYMRTWSATSRYLKDRGEDPVARHEVDLRRVWGEKGRLVNWPLTIRASCR